MGFEPAIMVCLANALNNEATQPEQGLCTFEGYALILKRACFKLT